MNLHQTIRAGTAEQTDFGVSPAVAGGVGDQRVGVTAGPKAAQFPIELAAVVTAA